jgi:hypothetical protein
MARCGSCGRPIVGDTTAGVNGRRAESPRPLGNAAPGRDNCGRDGLPVERFKGAAMSRTTWAAVAASACVALVGCAPDSWSNKQATGYNAFLNQIAQQCYPLQLGNDQMSQKIQRNAMDDNYIYFIDQTSRLYYGTISQGAYRSSINGFFMGSATTDVALDCILSKLPQNQK